MNELQREAFEAVQKINKELYEKYKKHDNLEYKPTLSVTFADEYILINILPASDEDINLPELLLYCSFKDDRWYYEKSNKFETFYKFIKRKFNIIKKELNEIKL